MAITHRRYAHGVKHQLAGDVAWTSNTIKVALITSSYTPSQAHEFFSTSVSANQVTGTGYTAGGDALVASAANTVLSTAAAARANSTVYQQGDIVRASTDNGHIFLCVVAGTSAASAPTWVVTPRRETADGTVVWVEAGTAYVMLDADNPSWPTSTITARYAVTYVVGAAGTADYLLSYLDFGQNESSSGDLFEVQWDPLGWAYETVDA